MRFTIERMRTLVLTAGVLLVIALVTFLVVGRWKRRFNVGDLLKPLGANIQQEANGWTYEHALGAHSQYKIHASKEVQFKKGDAVLHDVKIELYGEDGSRVDRIEGKEFEYDQKSGTVKAAGPVEITLMRPGVAPAVAPKAVAGQIVGERPKNGALASAIQTASSGEIHVETSGLSFDQKSGVATTSQKVNFSLAQGSGSAIGARYDSQNGLLILNDAVELNTRRGGESVGIHAQHGEFDRDTDLCNLKVVKADYRGGEATAGEAKVLFREDGTAVRLDATSGFTLATPTGGHVSAPTGSLEFDEHNQPRHGHLEGGVAMDSTSAEEGQSRQMHGISPAADFDFSGQGELRHAHFERGVEMRSEEIREASGGSKGESLRVSRTWRSPLADVEFRDAGHGQLEPAAIHGTQGVVITSESQRGKGTAVPSRLASDEVTGEFGPRSALTAMTGVGHASLEETTANGTRQTSIGDRLVVHFAPLAASGTETPAAGATGGTGQIQSAVLDGHVVLTQQPLAKAGAAPASMKATAGRALYESAGEWLHLTLNPRVEDGGLGLTADKIDVSHNSGDAFAHGSVKATWLGGAAGEADPGASGSGASGKAGSVVLGGSGPAHVIAAEAELRQATGEATFRGHARLWQGANSVSGPLIVLDRQRQTLVARSADSAEPVRVVLLSAPDPNAGSNASKNAGKAGEGKSGAPSVIRVRGGDLKYSDAERKAVMRGSALGSVVAETATATSVSDEVELTLLPSGNHAGKDDGQSQVDRLTARGHVVLTSQGRRGTGEQLVYSGETGEYVLTGSAASPPRMNDPSRGTVTGEVVTFNSRDNSVTVDGGGRSTSTETTSPRRQ